MKTMKTEKTSTSLISTAIVIALGAAALIAWRTALGHDDGILRLLRHFF